MPETTQTLTLTLAPDGLYDLEESYNLDLLLLALFLLEDGSMQYEAILAWLETNETIFTQESVTALTKHKEIISITGSFDEASDEEDAHTIELPCSDLQALLHIWYDKLQEEAPTITLQQSNGSFSIHD